MVVVAMLLVVAAVLWVVLVVKIGVVSQASTRANSTLNAPTSRKPNRQDTTYHYMNQNTSHCEA